MITKMGRALRTEAVQTKGALHVKVIADDPDDDKFLACATEGGADYVVSGDHHLLNLNSYQGICIVTPAAFLHVLKGA